MLLKIKLIIILFFLCLNFINPQEPANNEKSLKYFGFFMVDCGFNDPNDNEIKTNYIDEVKNFTNIIHISVSDDNDDIRERLKLMDSNKTKAILSIKNIFFVVIPENNNRSGMKYLLRKDFRKRWKNFIKINELENYINTITAFYIADEPFWNGASYYDLEKVARILKIDFPDTSILLIESCNVLDILSIPENIDWLGFIRFGITDPCTDEKYLEDLKKIKSIKSREDQKIIIIMETQWFPYYPEKYDIKENNLDIVAENYYKLAKTDKDIIGIIGYLWPGSYDHPDQKGARNLPETVKAIYKKIGKEITGK